MLFLYFSLIIILGKELLNFDEERLVVISLCIFIFFVVLSFHNAIASYFDSKISNIILLYKLFLTFKLDVIDIIINSYKKNAFLEEQAITSIALLDKKLSEFQNLNSNLTQIFWTNYIFNQLKTIIYEQEILKQSLQINLARCIIISFWFNKIGYNLTQHSFPSASFVKFIFPVRRVMLMLKNISIGSNLNYQIPLLNTTKIAQQDNFLWVYYLSLLHTF